MNNIPEPQVRVDELVNAFSTIDMRISELHSHSSGAFMQLNAYLKEYYQKITAISENASMIFDTLLGSEKNNLLEELERLSIEIKNYKHIADAENRKSIHLLTEINVKTSAISVALRNFIQDLTTFKYLITNYYLISNYENFSKEWNNAIDKWNNKISYIQPWLSTIIKKCDTLRAKVNSCINANDMLNAGSNNKIMSLSEEIWTIYHRVEEKGRQSEHFFPVLKEKSKRSSDSIGNIITHLQYHDIIRQKIEHIQKSHQNIIDALSIEKSELEKTVEPSRSILGQIADIVGLQAEQLILVSREYQNALEVISRNFLTIADDINTISNISNEFCSDGKNKEINLLKQVKHKLDDGILMLDVYNTGELYKDLKFIVEIIKELNKLTLNTITEPLNRLGKICLFNGIEKQTNGMKGNPGPAIIYQILSLAEDITEKKSDMEQRMTELLELALPVVATETIDGMGSASEQEQIRLMVKITRILDTLDEDSSKLDSVLSENNSFNMGIIDKIESTINKVDYYELFEKVLNYVIGELNNINAKLKSESENYHDNQNTDKIKEVESMYTVASERAIHNKYFKGDNVQMNDVSESPDDDVELF